MKYTAVFEWPDGTEPRIGKADSWKGGCLVTVEFDSDAIADRNRLVAALLPFAAGYHSDEYCENAIKALVLTGAWES